MTPLCGNGYDERSEGVGGLWRCWREREGDSPPFGEEERKYISTGCVYLALAMSCVHVVTQDA